MRDFDKWWRDAGSGIRPLENHDAEQHAKRIAHIAWEQANDWAIKDLRNLCYKVKRRDKTIRMLEQAKEA